MKNNKNKTDKTNKVFENVKIKEKESKDFLQVYESMNKMHQSLRGK